MSVSEAYHILFWGALIVLAVYALTALLRTITGRTTVDKIVGVNLINTVVVMAIAVLTVLLREDYVADIAVVYVMISFVAVMLLCKIYINLFAADHDGSHRKGGDRHDR